MKTMKTHIIPTLVLAALLPGSAFAQVPNPPTRPGLNLNEPARQPQQTQRPSNQMPATDLVQRDMQGRPVQGQPQPAPRQTTPQGPPEEFFYVEDGSAGPGNLAAGLSEYNTQRMSQAGSQLGGNYGNMQPYGSLPAGVVQDAWSRPFDNMSAGQSAPGSIRYQWTSDLVMPVRLRAGMVTSVVLPEWDAAQDVIIGDGAAVEATILRPNQVAVKSVQTGLDTSLSVIGGSGNVYTFYLRTEGRNTDLVTDLQVFVQAAPSRGNGDWFNGEVRNAYVRGMSADARQNSNSGQGEGARNSSADRSMSGNINVPAAASQGDEPVPTDRRDFNLKMYEVNEGDRIIAPEYAYTDGRFTYLHFSPGVTDRPAVFRIVDGVEGRVNTRVTGRHSEVIVVEAIGDLILRSGTRAVCIVTVDENEMPSYRRN